jgi:transcriptional regulator with XRE-family HTH domain|uniref:RstR phage-related transcriptional repressor n=1 Tax=Rheinheimera sp. BAL341 TaxID=1708203 RepID=A0A486XW56_9GAMM
MAEEQAFYLELGQRLAGLRKQQGLTQTQLAEQLGIAQQTMAHYEGGKLRISVELLVLAAKVLNVPIASLLGEETSLHGKRGPASVLEKQLAQISLLPRAKQKFISQMLDTVLAQHGG